MENIDNIIARVLSGEATAEERAELDKWIAADKTNKEVFEKMQAFWLAKVEQKESSSAKLAWEKLQAKIETKKAKKINLTEKRHRTIPMWAYASAASIVVIIAISLFFMKSWTSDDYWRNYTANNEQKIVTLDDGTKITLNKNSELKCSNKFGKSTRTIKLEGEALFEVAKDAEHPFVVEMSDNTSITVLGTTFTVKANEQANQIIATLVEGSIKFSANNKDTFIKPNEQIVYSRTLQKAEVRQLDDASGETAWLNGCYKYRSISFATLIADLERNYNVKIKIENGELNNAENVVTATFYQNQNIEEIFQIISNSLPITWTKTNDVYIIK